MTTFSLQSGVSMPDEYFKAKQQGILRESPVSLRKNFSISMNSLSFDLFYGTVHRADDRNFLRPSLRCLTMIHFYLSRFKSGVCSLTQHQAYWRPSCKRSTLPWQKPTQSLISRKPPRRVSDSKARSSALRSSCSKFQSNSTHRTSLNCTVRKKTSLSFSLALRHKHSLSTQ